MITPKEVCELTYRSYRWQRMQFPQYSAERWKSIFPEAEAFELRYQQEIFDHNQRVIEGGLDSYLVNRCQPREE